MLVIHPDECIDCGVCVPECPVDAIKPDTEPGLELANQSIREAAALLETPPVGTATAPVPPAPRTGTYRQVNRNKSGGTKPDT
jgi:ferredoxin